MVATIKGNLQDFIWSRVRVKLKNGDILEGLLKKTVDGDAFMIVDDVFEEFYIFAEDDVENLTIFH